jgi:hypothetical protein
MRLGDALQQEATVNWLLGRDVFRGASRRRKSPRRSWRMLDLLPLEPMTC